MPCTWEVIVLIIEIMISPPCGNGVRALIGIHQFDRNLSPRLNGPSEFYLKSDSPYLPWLNMLRIQQGKGGTAAQPEGQSKQRKDKSPVAILK